MIKKLLLSGGVAGAALASVAGVVDARSPARRGCYGESISALAGNQEFPGAFGAGVKGFAQAPDGKAGLGDGVQLLQAGGVPDDVVPNTCND